MIYGSINLDKNLSDSERLNHVGNILKWNGCIPETFSRDAFSGIFLFNENSFLKKEDVFYEDHSNGRIILLDGYIYNQQELIHKLQLKKTDTAAPELIAEAFDKWGEQFAVSLNGDFAICIYDLRQGQALFYVDHLGIRPFAISKIENTIYFSTDVIGLSKGLYGHYKIDQKYLLNLFLYEGYKYLLTPHRSVERIIPGHYIKCNKEENKTIKYWHPENLKTDSNLTQQQLFRDLKLLLSDSINIRADKRFRASAHISGGFDSSIVAAMTRKAYAHQANFFGFSWSPEPDDKIVNDVKDERSRVIEICRQNNMIPIFSNYSLNEYLAFVSEWRCPSELMCEKNIVEKAKKKGVDLIFSGWGGDEFISIPNRGVDADLFKSFNVKHFIRKFPFWRLRKSAVQIYKEIDYYLKRRKYTSQMAETYIFPYLQKVLKTNRIPYRKRFHHYSRRIVHLQLINMHHLAARTADWYVNGQLHGIEYRYPLLDKRIVEYMMRVPSKHLVNGSRTRIVLSEIGKGIISDDVLVKLSKNDPANAKAFDSAASRAKERFIEEYKEFRKNPDLSFVDFDKLEQDLPRMSVSPRKDKPIPAEIFYALKTAHEFTKGYYN